MSRGFQTGGFQRGGFQQLLNVGSGGWTRIMFAQMLALARRKAKAREKVKPEEEIVVAVSTVELSFRAVAPQPMLAPTLVKLIGSKRINDVAELAEYRDVMALILELEDA